MLKNLNTSIDLNDPNILYVNLNINDNCKNNSNFFGSNPPMRLDKPIPSGILNDSSNEYEMTIGRFSFSGSPLLPIWTPVIDTTQTNTNQTVYKITMKSTIGGTTYTTTQPILYIAEDNSAFPTSQVNNLLADTRHYYYVYTYAHVAYLINNCLTACYNDIVAQVHAVNAGYAFQSISPFIRWNESSLLYELYFDTANELFQIAFDANLYNLFSSFYVRNGFIVVDSQNGLYKITLDNDRTFIKVSQNWSSTSNWSPVGSIVFTSEKLAVNSEIVIPPQVMTDVSIFNDDTTAYPTKRIISDFQIPFDYAHDARQYITYTPTLYRWISLNGRDNIKDLDINVFFLDRYSSNLIPILIPNSANLNIKLCFRKKNI